jgi:hypothetical protein
MQVGLRGCEGMGEKHENTNLASEFYVLSMLHRKGLEPSLTLGNKKSVDIILTKEDKIITIDVKGIQSKNVGFPMDNWNLKKPSHFLIFVGFKDISNHKVLENNPECYIVPSTEIDNKFKELELDSYKKEPGKLLCRYSTRCIVDLSRLRKLAERYKYRWDLIK